MSVYDLMVKRDKLKNEITILSEKTNSNFGRDVSIWNSLSRKQEELKDIENKMKKIECDDDRIKAQDMLEKIKKYKDKKVNDEFEIAYEKYEKYVEQNSSGLVTTGKHDFIRFYSFYSEIIQPDMLKLIKAVAGISND